MFKRMLGLLLACNLPLAAEIIEVDSFAALKAHAQPQSLVLIDLDHCLWQGKTHYGHAEWFYTELRQAASAGKDKYEHLRSVYHPWIKSQRHVEVEPLDPAAVAVIQGLQEQGVAVMGFTHRQPSVRHSTLRQVASLGIDFRLTAPTDDIFSIELPDSAHFCDGVLFVADYNQKGGVLALFLDRIGLQAKHVLFIDDGLKHLQSVEAEMANRELPFTGLHYRGYDELGLAWEPELHEMQEKFLDRILSDDEARRLIANSPENGSGLTPTM